MKIEFIINLIAAKQIGPTIPPNVLVRANKVIRWQKSEVRNQASAKTQERNP